MGHTDLYTPVSLLMCQILVAHTQPYTPLFPNELEIIGGTNTALYAPRSLLMWQRATGATHGPVHPCQSGNVSESYWGNTHNLVHPFQSANVAESN
jgi:hypothetical protein